jgi:demethylmenaquinone methyltransferase/2-methoxy-6-polyprenyl-1,4-benzoquinol methylase
MSTKREKSGIAADQTRQTKEVQQMFDDIAPTYDRVNHILSLSIDKLWRRHTVNIVERLRPRRILDLATGTGDLAIAMARRIKDVEICGADLSAEMMAVAVRKVAALNLQNRITFTQCGAVEIGLEDGSIDVVTIAFGIRNFENREASLAEIFRTLRSGGHLVILEFSNPRNRFVGWMYRIYTHKILPFIGGLISKNRRAYEYLPASVDEFPEPEEFIEILKRSGFTNIARHAQSLGIAQIYVAQRNS